MHKWIVPHALGAKKIRLAPARRLRLSGRVRFSAHPFLHAEQHTGADEIGTSRDACSRCPQGVLQRQLQAATDVCFGHYLPCIPSKAGEQALESELSAEVARH